MSYLTWCLTPNVALRHAAPVVLYMGVISAFAVAWSW